MMLLVKVLILAAGDGWVGLIPIIIAIIYVLWAFALVGKVAGSRKNPPRRAAEKARAAIAPADEESAALVERHHAAQRRDRAVSQARASRRGEQSRRDTKVTPIGED